MLRRLSIKNLGAFGENQFNIDFSEETLIAGPNNSGKSLALSAINFLRNYILTRDLYFTTQFYNFVSFKEIVHGHYENRIIQIELEFSQGGKVVKTELTLGKNRPTTFTIAQDERKRGFLSGDENLLSDIWYLKPDRVNIPFSSIVQPSSTPFQPLNPNGSNVINFLLERYTDRDSKWGEAETWLRKIDPEITEMKTPIRGNSAFLETTFGEFSVNTSLQGSGIQNAVAIIAAVVFSDKGSTIIIEEPEAFLHPSSQEIIVDLFNDAVNNKEKQIIFTTHSFNIIKPFYNDVGVDRARRGQEHPRADRNKFSMLLTRKQNGQVSVDGYPIQEKTFRQLRDDFKQSWG
jgi:predicted ATPase